MHEKPKIIVINPFTVKDRAIPLLESMLCIMNRTVLQNIQSTLNIKSYFKKFQSKKRKMNKLMTLKETELTVRIEKNTHTCINIALISKL
jgi:hypothetical protein